MNSPTLFQQSKILIPTNPRSLEIIPNDKDRHLLVGGDNHWPQYPGLDVRAMAARLPHEPKTRQLEYALERLPIDRSNFGHSSLRQPKRSAAPPHATQAPANTNRCLWHSRTPPTPRRGSRNRRRSRGIAGRLRRSLSWPLPAMGHCWPHPMAWHARQTDRPHARPARCNQCPSQQRATANVPSPVVIILEVI